jgi:hypothetical protein
MSLAGFNLWIGYLTTAAAAWLLVRLLWLGLARRYAWLFCYFLADILESVLVIDVSRRSLWYAYVYFAGQAAKTILAVGVSVELWREALRGYPAMARFGRQAAAYILAAALLLATVGLVLEPPRSAGQHPFQHYFNAFEGVLDSTVVLFLVAATLFLLWFPVTLPRNLAVIMAAFVFYLLERWAALLLVNLYPKSVRSLSAVMLSLELACLIFAIFAVRRSGRNPNTVPGHRWNLEETERLLGQLKAINTRLEQTAR